MAKEDWKLCVEWLVRCQVLPPDHKLARDDAEVFDLAQYIRDGVMLCHLVNHLSPGCISLKDFSQRPQMSQFLCLKNIRTFLQTCRSVFKMSDQDLFEPTDLFEVKDFGKVINTLCVLSWTPVAESKTPGFKAKSRADKSEEYFSLHTLAGNTPEDEYDAVYNDNDNEIYEDLCALRRRTSMQEPAPVTKRDHCIQELYETEKNYIEALAMIINCFIKRLNGRIQDFDIIFFRIEELHAIHVGFHSDLQKACSNRHNTFMHASSQLTIADCFIKWKEKLLMYGEYCANLSRVQTLLDKLMQNQAASQSIMECQTQANGGKFRLRDLLSVPMQRVLKYHLLLKELIKNTDAQHPDRKSLEKALDEMQDLAGYINEVKRDSENMQTIQEVEHSITDFEMPSDSQMSDYGRLHLDGELRVRKITEKKDRNLMLFLFDKVLIICKSRMVDKFRWNENYVFKDALDLDHFDVEELTSKEKDRFGIQLSTKKTRPEPHVTWLIFAKTPDLRTKWTAALNLAYENRHPPHAETDQHKFVMATFSEPTICDVCRKLLRGIFYQGYRCQKTSMAVHKGCIEKARDMNGPPVVPPKRITGAPASPLPGGNRTLTHARVKAISAYHGTPAPPNGQPLPFEVNSIISLVSDEDPQWWQGQLQGREGFFPKSFVVIVKSNRPQQQASVVSRSPSSEVPSTPHTAAVPISLLSNTHLNGCTTPASPAALPPHLQSPSTEHHSYFNTFLPVTPPVANTANNMNSGSIADYSWYLGELNREEATRLLDKMPNGTFLIRMSNAGARKGELALSIRYGPSNPVKHIKVQRNAEGMYFLVDCKMFRSIPELVQYYQTTSLERSFPEVPSTLGLPYKDAIAAMVPPKANQEAGVVGYCQAQYDYSPMEPNQIAFKVGDQIAIVSKSRGNLGWWKGKIDGKVGYFPSEYVVEL